MGWQSRGSRQQANDASEEVMGAESFAHHDEVEYQDEYAEPTVLLTAGSDVASASVPAPPSPDQTDDAMSFLAELEGINDPTVGWVEPHRGKADPHLNPDGTLGGLVAHTAHVDSSARVDPHAMVLDNARVFGDAVVADRAVVHGNARLLDGARVGGRAQVGEAATVGQARVLGDARVLGTARLDGGATVQGQAYVGGQARVLGEAVVDGAATVDDRAFVAGGHVTGTVHVSGRAVIRGGSWASGAVADGDRDHTPSAQPLESMESQTEVEATGPSAV